MLELRTAMENQQSRRDRLLDAVSAAAQHAVGEENLGRRLINVRWSTLSLVQPCSGQHLLNHCGHEDTGTLEV